MFRSTALKSLRAPLQAQTQTRSFVSKAQLVGRLGAAPEKGTTSGGQDYYRYSLAVTKPGKRDAEGIYTVQLCLLPCRKTTQLIDLVPLDPVRESSWFTVFNFKERAAEALEKLQPGSLLYVEAQIDTITTPPPADGQPGSKQYVFRESSHRVLSKPKSD
ncbi:hypothetical protein L486_05973 [Kwoniella mangroviensis CBS 10435]|uniref:Uncharacterized protein n=1 Tax=Kwoniella mangroviensis CBS 10435 TaxID=1331196 RepID=A0A1B9IP30_9TREE|nr:uncharacterized protein I203_03246 [Kwoniella mangroviensis CBS 8507]OCF57114.1 hypothetical protein L486_05973 [Kwoniella mangroviensis CBS 10435]OCF67549.1 hypothetical protein I203_03246 [Kwoniella mangroviensis CBS 8507]